jgi:hypothetical protein
VVHPSVEGPLVFVDYRSIDSIGFAVLVLVLVLVLVFVQQLLARLSVGDPLGMNPSVVDPSVVDPLLSH